MTDKYMNGFVGQVFNPKKAVCEVVTLRVTHANLAICAQNVCGKRYTANPLPGLEAFVLVAGHKV